MDRREKNRLAAARYRERHPDRVKASERAYRVRNAEAARFRTRIWASNNKRTLKRIKFATRLKRYGLTVEDWARAFHGQGGQCSGCLAPLQDGWRTAVDHSHRTGKFRGLLCIRCNRSLGVLLESPDTLRRLAAYVEAHR